MNAGIVNALKVQLGGIPVAVDGTNSNKLVATIALQDPEEAVNFIEQALPGLGISYDQATTQVTAELFQDPHCYDIVEIVDAGSPRELARGYSEFEAAQEALRNVRRRKTVQDPKKVIVVAQWQIDEEDSESLRPESEVPGEGVEIETEQFEEAVAEAEAELMHNWISFADAAARLGVRYQQVYQRAVVRHRMRHLSLSGAGSENSHLYAHVDDIQEWEIERAKRLAKTKGGKASVEEGEEETTA